MPSIILLSQTALLDELLGSAAICRTGIETVRLRKDDLVSFQWFAVFLGGWSLVVNLLLTLEAIFYTSRGRAKFTAYRNGSACSRGLNSKDIPYKYKLRHSLSGFARTIHFNPLDVHANLNEPLGRRSLQELCSKFWGDFNVLL